MPKSRGASPVYTEAEKIALVTKVDHLVRVGGLTLTAAVKAAGTNSASYANWTRAGIRPLPAAHSAPAPVPPAERARLVSEVQARCVAGMDVRQACREVGISDHRYYKWRRQGAPLPAMRPVEVTTRGPEITALVPVAPAPLALASARPSPEAPAQNAGLVLVAPGGFRVEGLAVESAAALLRALA